MGYIRNSIQGNGFSQKGARNTASPRKEGLPADQQTAMCLQSLGGGRRPRAGCTRKEPSPDPRTRRLKRPPTVARGARAMSYVLRLKELMPLLDDIIALDREIVVGASDGEISFRIHVPHVTEDLQKVWKDFLVSYAKALKAKHGDLPIEIEDIEGKDWVENVVRTV